MTGLFRKLVVLAVASVLAAPGSVLAQGNGRGSGGSGGITPQIIGTEPHASLTVTGKTDGFVAEADLTLTAKVHNYTATMGGFHVTCAAVGQVTCNSDSVTPDDVVDIAGGGSYSFHVTLHGFGAGSGTATITLWNDKINNGNTVDDQEDWTIPVGGTPMMVHLVPVDSTIRTNGAPLQASFRAGVDSASVKVWISNTLRKLPPIGHSVS